MNRLGSSSIVSGKFSPFATRRQRAVVFIGLAAAALIVILFIGLLTSSDSASTHLEERNLAPSLSHWFGTDWLGRDMFIRTMQGLSLSIGTGLAAALASTAIAAVLGLVAASFGKAADRFITWLVDTMLSVPHLVLLIMISFVTGGGIKGVVIGIALTHWPNLARVIRAEVLQLQSSDYVHAARMLGKSKLYVAVQHIFPHVLPQLGIGLLLIFPHAVLHEAAISFLGLGLSPHQPAIGIILSESMRYLSTGMWWLALFPGLCLLISVRLFDRIGEELRRLTDPRGAQE